MDYTSSDVAELTALVADKELDGLIVIRMARNDLASGLVETAITRLLSDADKIRPLNRTLYNVITNW